MSIAAGVKKDISVWFTEAQICRDRKTGPENQGVRSSATCRDFLQQSQPGDIQVNLNITTILEQTGAVSSRT